MDEPLYEVFEKYTPPIRSKKHTCVGLGMELIRRWRELDSTYPGFGSAMALVSCEEAVVDIHEYVSVGDSPLAVAAAEKEHVMVAVKILVDGRVGVILADPGYHVPRVITVMADRTYPHTGWFTQSDEAHCRKEYTYNFSPSNTAYVEWHERETRGSIIKSQTSLVYVARPYLDSVNVTERRNLVYNFRSLLARDQKGHVVAGLYFPVSSRKDAAFTLFFDTGTEKRRTKYKFSSLREIIIPQSLLKDIEICNTQMNYAEGELLGMLCELAIVVSDKSFIEQVLAINDVICRLCL